MSETLFVVNPRAGSGRAAALWRDLLVARPELVGARQVEAKTPEVARAAVREALEEGVERIVSVGGDGTIHQVANALLASGAGSRVVLGLVPAGTGSDLSRTLRLPREPAGALEYAISAPGRPLDAMAVDGASGRRYSVNITSIGVSGLVVQKVNAMPKRGQLAFLGAALGAFLRYRPRECRVVLDGDLWFEGPLLVIAIANGTSFGKGMRVAPRAVPDDGLLDVVLVGPVPVPELVFRLPQLYLGRHLRSRRVRAVRALRAEIEPLEPIPAFDLDGEDYPSEAIAVEIMPGALRFAAPALEPE